MMQQLLPLLLDWLSASPDPDLGLLGLRRLASGEQRSTRAGRPPSATPPRSPATSPSSSGRAGTSATSSSPTRTSSSGSPIPTACAPVRGTELVASGSTPSRGGRIPTTASGRCSAGSSGTCSAWPRRTCSATPTVEQVGAPTSPRSPRPSLEGALRSLDPQVPFAVVAFGRFGGAELGYASDLDLAFVHDGAAARRRRGRAGGRRACCGSWAVRPRPSGSGPWTPTSGRRVAAVRWPGASRAGTATSIGGRRPGSGRRTCVSGAWRATPTSVAARRSHPDGVWARPLARPRTREVRRMKVRIERERIAPRRRPRVPPQARARLARPTSSSPCSSSSSATECPRRRRWRRSARWWRPVTSPRTRPTCSRRPTGSASGRGTAASSWSARATRCPTRPEQATPLARSLGCTVAGAAGGVPAGHASGPPGRRAPLLRPGLSAPRAMLGTPPTSEGPVAKGNRRAAAPAGEDAARRARTGRRAGPAELSPDEARAACQGPPLAGAWPRRSPGGRPRRARLRAATSRCGCTRRPTPSGRSTGCCSGCTAAAG